MNTKEAVLKHKDLIQVSNILAQEFNNTTMHDRVLVFEVLPMEDGMQDIKDTCQRFGNETTNQASLLDENEVRREDMITLEQKGKRKTGEGETNLIEKEGKTESSNDETMTELEKERKGIATQHGQDSDRGVDEGGPEKRAKLFVHSSLLADHSTYFKSLFFGSFKESHLKEVVMKVHADELQGHLTLVEAMYKPDILNGKDLNLILDVLVLTEKYDAKFLKMRCTCLLMLSVLTLKKCQKIIERIVQLTEVEDLLDVVQRFIVEEFSPLDKSWRMHKFRNLSEDSLRLLLASDDLAVRSENTVFVALMWWIDVNLRKSRISLEGFLQSTLLGLVRFELMSVDFLYDVVRHHKLAKQMTGFPEYFQQGLAYHAFSKKRRQQLKVKPVPRAIWEDDDSHPTFSWVINKDVREILQDSQVAHSDSFWFHGYQMELKMSYSAESETFGFYLVVLELQNMQEDFSSPDIHWTAESDLFNPNNTILTIGEAYDTYENEDTYSGFPKLGCSFPLHSVPEGSSHKIDVVIWVVRLIS